MRVLGLDIGFGQVKVVSEDTKLKFPSQIAQYIPDSVSDLEYVEHKGMLYVVGEDANVFRQKFSLSTVENLIKYAPVLLKYVLNRLKADDKYVVVSGLPPRFRDYAVEFEKALKVEGVESVVVVPQGVGIVEDTKGRILLHQNALVLDIGFNTVDYISVRVKDQNIIKERSGTIEGLGVKSAVEIFRSMLPAEVGYYRNEPYVFLVPILIKGSVQIAGELINLESIKQKALKIWSEQINLRLTEEIGELIKGKELFVVGGGGAYFLDREVFEREVFVPFEPDFSNARGYYKIGSAHLF